MQKERYAGPVFPPSLLGPARQTLPGTAGGPTGPAGHHISGSATEIKWQRGGMKTFSSVPANVSAQEWARNKIQSLTPVDRQRLFQKFNERTVFDAASKVFN